MSKDNHKSHSLITSLLQPKLYDPPVDECVLIETHISFVILAGSYAYKIKKALNLGFLDFSTLDKRHFYCDEELRLNKRLAPEVYLDVLPITGTSEHPRWGGGGVAIEYAIKMRAFPQQAQLDRLLALDGVQAGQIDILAEYIANFHQQVEVAEVDSSYGKPELIYQPVEENFKQIKKHVTNPKAVHTLVELQCWSHRSFLELQKNFAERKISGFIRECHGDLHLQNIAWLDDGPLIFDCIEFSPHLRWIDVISDVAFLVMDLQDRNQPVLARRFLNNYLEQTGDYTALSVLRFYQVYRAMVRAKIDAIRAHQPGIHRKERQEAEKDFFGYLNLAADYIRPVQPQLIIMRGMSASGKSTLSKTLLEQLGAIRIRSDVERKRLFGIQAEDNGVSAVGKTIYSPAANTKTYNKLRKLAERIIDAGYSVIVDAVFLHSKERQMFRELAISRKIVFVIVECLAETSILRQRIVGRTRCKDDASDADLAVLEMQLSKWQTLKQDEQNEVITIDTSATIDVDAMAMRISSIVCPHSHQ